MTESAIPAKSTQAAVIFVFITLMLDVLAMGVVIPVLPKLIAGFLHGERSDAVRIGGLISLVWAGMQFVCTPIQGALSDRFGRRPVLLLSMTGLGLDYVLMALAPTLTWLFIARVISGATAASFGTANAYIADITPPEKRAAAFGMMGAAFGIGFILGPALGGFAGSFDPRLPFWVAAGFSLLNALYGYFILPESLPRERRAKFSLARANPVGAFKLLASNTQLAGLATAQFFYIVAHNVYPACFVWFTMYRYGWNEKSNGLALALTGVMSIIVQGGLVGPVVKSLGTRRAAVVGLLFGITGFVIYAVGPTDISVWIAIPVASLWGFYGPAAQTLMTQHVSQTQQGQLQGALGSLMGIASIISPPLYTNIFAAAIDWQSKVSTSTPILGAPFFVAAFLLGCALIFVLRVVRMKHVASVVSESL
jgi:DHA1 family tetracycline resistance protein-like MFS transporter